MSYCEALADSIPMEKDKKGFTRYYPPCRVCGAPICSWSYIRGAEYICKECRQYLLEIETERNLEIATDKKACKLDEAIKRISRKTNIKLYEDAIDLVSQNLNKPRWFQSTEEIMVALELLRRRIITHHQVRVFNYYVDFVLPEYMVALEIDGPIFHCKEFKKQELIRDEAIIKAFGDGWEVIRISTEHINTNITKLFPAIKAVLKRRKSKQK